MLRSIRVRGAVQVHSVAVGVEAGRGAPPRRARMRRGLAAALVATLGVLAAPLAAQALLITYAFGGVVTHDQIDLYFPNKNVGDAYTGTFTLDTLATQTSNAGTYATYSGAFALTLEGVPQAVNGFRVWSSGPSGISDGFELTFGSGSDGGFLSLRSSTDIYQSPLVPLSVNIAQMDVSAQVIVTRNVFPQPSKQDRGTILALQVVPEPGTALLVGMGLAAMGRAGRRRVAEGIGMPLRT